MRLKLVSVAVLAIFAGLGGAHAQSANDFGGPRELPPASFSGQQFVDSKGCVFLRAGVAGRTNWVPRVSRDRTPLCGYPPTFGANQVAIVDPVPRNAPAPAAAAPAPAPEATRVTRRPLDTVASTTAPPRIRVAPPQQRVDARTYAPAPVVAAPAPRVVATPQPQTRRQPAERAGTVSSGGKIGCYTDAPVAERFRLHGGGTVVMCTRGDGDLDNARPPRVPGGVAAVAPSGFLEGHDPVRGASAPKTGKTHVAISSQDYRNPPPGFKRAWEDDRLNPNRAKGTRAGWEAQDQVWTRETPARLVEEAARPKGNRVSVRRVHASSKSEPAAEPQAATGRLFVQVGTFGVAANAEGASARLAQLGLPVARSRAVRNGATLQTVLAGPFASQSQAQAALSAARKAGFGDAFLR